MNSTSVPEQFFGKYKLERTEHFDEYLASDGVNWFTRKMIELYPLTVLIEKSDEQPGKYTLRNLAPLMGLEYRNWSLGEEFENKGFDGKEQKIMFEMSGDSTLSERHVRRGGEKVETFNYTVEGDYLVVNIEQDKVTCKWFLKRSD